MWISSGWDSARSHKQAAMESEMAEFVNELDAKLF